MNNNQKKYFHINSSTSTDQIFALLDTVQSDNKNEFDKLMKDSDTDFIAPEKIKLTGNPYNLSVVTPEIIVYVVAERSTHTKEIDTNKKKKQARRKYLDHMNTSIILIVEFPTNSIKVLQLSISMNKLLIFML